MMVSGKRPPIGALIYFAVAFTASAYFAFAAVQGDYGIFRRVQVDAEAKELRAERDQLQAELDTLKNKTRRLSDAYLDLDLLSQQARDVLGYLRPDEVMIR
jgi:cell division protein FtsB